MARMIHSPRVMVGWLLTIVCGVNTAGQVRSQAPVSIFANTITGSNPSADNPFTAGQFVDSNLTVSGIGRGPALTAVADVDRYTASGWTSVNLNPDAYFSWTLTPRQDYTLNLERLDLNYRRSGNGPSNFAVRSSLDNFTSDLRAFTLGSADLTPDSISLTSPAFDNLTTSVEFRFYGWNANNANGSFAIADFNYFGAAAPVPEPGLGLLAVVALLAMGHRLRGA